MSMGLEMDGTLAEPVSQSEAREGRPGFLPGRPISIETIRFWSAPSLEPSEDRWFPAAAVGSSATKAASGGEGADPKGCSSAGKKP